MAHAPDTDGSLSAPSPDDARLTAREQTVLALSATGRTVTEVAVILEMSQEAVRDTLASVVRKLKARSRLEAVIIAFRNGLLDDAPGP